MFSPYYAWARARGHADPENHCAFNLALYGDGGKRWAMTERGRSHLQRTHRRFSLGPSAMGWEGDALVVDIDERCAPLPWPVRGRIRLLPQALSAFVATLDSQGRHHWGPIAACARIEVELQQPALRWSGHAYLDANQGDEPVEAAFSAWDWARGGLQGGDTMVLYDLSECSGAGRVIARRFARDGSSQPFEAPARCPLPSSAWRVSRHVRSEASRPPRLLRTLEDTPFYVRSQVSTQVLGQSVECIHESLDVPRVVSWPVRLMLPWRMPRRA